MSARRGVLLANKAFLNYACARRALPCGSIRFYKTATSHAAASGQAPQFNETTIEHQGAQGFAAMDPQKRKEAASKGGQASHGNANKQQAQTYAEVDKKDIIAGDLVGYSVGANKTEGLVVDLFDKPFTDEKKVQHNASAASPIVKIENYFTRHFSFHRLDSLEWIARKQEFESHAGQSKAQSSAQTNQARTTAQAPGAKAQAAPAQSAESKQSQQLARSAEKLEQDLNGENSPLNLNFAPGDIVRYRTGNNYTAGAILEIVFRTVHDEHGNFHGATKENPMARLENLWTKNITYHHLNVLEHIRRSSDIEKEHGRYAQSEFSGKQ